LQQLRHAGQGLNLLAHRGVLLAVGVGDGGVAVSDQVRHQLVVTEADDSMYLRHSH